MEKRMEYLRIVLTDKCNLRCEYCHNEGFTQKGNQILDSHDCIKIMRSLYKNGVRKVKLMGGEPSLYCELPQLIESIRQIGDDIDISMISNGLFDTKLITTCVNAGLNRINISIHSWGHENTMHISGMNKGRLATLKDNLCFLVDKGLLSKINYVLTGMDDVPELLEVIEWANQNKVVIDILNVLTGLGTAFCGYIPFAEIEKIVRDNFDIKGEYTKDNKYSIPSKRLIMSEGGEVNLKVFPLNEEKPFKCCKECEQLNVCIEGIKAIRLLPGNVIQPCLMRTDNALSISRNLSDKELDILIGDYLLNL